MNSPRHKFNTVNISNKFKKFFSSRSFTLVEILLVVSLFSMVGVALYHSLSGGLRIWSRTEQLAVEEDIMIFFDKFSQDLRNTFVFSQLTFEGDSRELRFPTIILTDPDPRSSFEPGQPVEQIGRVVYSFDPGTGGLYRRQDNYSQSLREKAGPRRQLVGSIESARFRYYYKTRDAYGFEPETQSSLPIGVQVEVEFLDGKKNRRLQKFVSLPVVDSS